MNELTRLETGLTTMQHEVAQMNPYDLYTNTLTPMTKKNYISTIKGFFGVEDLSQITIDMLQSVTPEIVNLWANKQLEEGVAKSTINNKLSGLQNFYKFLCRRNIGIMSYNPFETSQGAIRFKNASKDYSDKRILSSKEMKKIFKEAEKEGGIIGARDLLVLELLATTGMRRAELCSIKIGDITTNMGTKLIQITGKGNKKRIVVISETVDVLIKNYLKLRGVSYQDKELPLIISHSSNADPTEHVTTMTIYRIVKKYADKAGLDADTISPHCMRATFATTSYGELGMDSDTIRELMGHTSQTTTQKYIKALRMVKTNPANKLDKMFNE